MGHRASFVRVDDRGRWRLHYSHWAANGVYSSLAAGPGAATRFIEAQQVCHPTEGWLDDRWAEGGAVVDHLARQLVYFGNDILMELPVKRAFAALLARTWPGWQVRWAYDGIGDLAAHVGVDRGVVRVPELVDRRMPRPAGDNLRWPFHLLTIRLADGQLQAFGWDDRVQTAWQGPALLDRLPGPGAERLDLPEIPASGVHVDVAECRVGLWMTRWADGLLPALDELWPGWTVSFWGDRYEEQLDRTGGAVTAPAIGPSDGLAELARALEHGRTSDPVRRGLETIAALEATGEEVEVNPDITRHVPVAPTETEWAAVQAALAALGRPN